MYLHSFSEKEKQAYWVLAKAVINADLVLTQEEEGLLDEYLNEMNMERSVLDNSGMDMEKAFAIIEEGGRKTKIMAFTELYALALCDNEYSLEERELMGMIQDRFSIAAEEMNDIESCIRAISTGYAKLNMLVNS